MRIDDIPNFQQLLYDVYQAEKTPDETKVFEDVVFRYQRFGGAGYITRKQYQFLLDLLEWE